MPIATIAEALKAFANGEFLIVIDNPSRENEGDLIISSAHLTPKKMAFMIRYTSGLICVPMAESRLLELGLPDMVERNEESLRTAYTISCDSKLGVTTGISATDRAHTCNVLAGSDTTGVDIVRPGHVFPLRAREGGVLVRDGHTEAAVDLCKLAGLRECAAISEIVRDEDGEMARTEELLKRGEEWGVKVITIEDLKAHRLSLESGRSSGTKITIQSIPEGTELLSTILYTACSFFLLDLHVARLQKAATSLGWSVPQELDVQREIYQAILGKAHLTLKLRLTSDRSGRIRVQATAIQVQKNLLGPFSSGTPLQGLGPQTNEVPMSGQSWTIHLDNQATLTRDLWPLIANKTTSRAHYLEPLERTGTSIARNEEVLLYNELGQITEGTITNIIVQRDGRWVTPSIGCGLLDGVMRRSLLDSGKVTERIILKAELRDGEEVLLCNALRGVLRATLKMR